jgi:inner membrane protein
LDSLTQITLGAAVGELTLGKKVGNRAMLWGAIAGTIPDLDVLAGFFMKDVFLVMDELQALMFHRGPMHSLLFAVLFSVPMAYYTYWLYNSGTYQKKGFKNLSFGFGVFFVGFAFYLVGTILLELFGLGAMLTALLITISIASYFFWRLWKHYMAKPSYEIKVPYWQWYLLFLLAIGTHPVLDCFTVYGTEIFWPFIKKRVAISNISVVDPLYTFPFLVCVLVASFLSRTSTARFRWNLAGVVMSSVYMCITLYNQSQVSKILGNTLKAENITANRSMVTPSILNNILWNCTVETDSIYYLGMYSFFDAEKKFQLKPIAANHDLIKGLENDHTISELRFFSNDYYSIMERPDGQLQLNDMRYGMYKGNGSEPSDYIFHFILEEKEAGGFTLGKTEAGPEEGQGKDLMKDLWNRMMGKLE